MEKELYRECVLTSPRLRGEVGLRSNPGEGDSQRTLKLRRLLKQPLTPTLSPLERGEGAHQRGARERS
jgi:hypothetical protein